MDGTGTLSEVEALVLGTFRHHVGEHVELDDDFFEVGGVSLTAAMCTADLRRNGMNVSLRELFRQRSARRLAAAIPR